MSCRNRAIIGCLLLSLAVVSSGCCTSKRIQPNHPGTVQGWKDFHLSGMHIIGQLVLKKGESSHNNKIAIKVIDINNPSVECGLLPESPVPRAKIQFYSLSDHKILCEVSVSEGNNSLKCDPELGISVMGVNAINNQEGWIYFDLRE